MPLASLPVEIIHTIIEYLDLISILNLSLTNHKHQSQIQSHANYSLLTTNTATRSTIKLLSQTSLIHNHTLSTLWSSLHAEACSCCHRKEAQYLSLPLGTRACFTCLHDCPRFQLLPMDLAVEAFGVSATDLAGPTLHTVPGMYRVKEAIYKVTRSLPLINTMQARDLAVRIKGADDLDQYMKSRGVTGTVFIAPVAAKAYVDTAYRYVRLDVCAICSSEEHVMRARDVAVVHEKRVGLALMGCELWPKMTDGKELVLDEGLVVGWRVRNDYKERANQVVAREEAARLGIKESEYLEDAGARYDV